MDFEEKRLMLICTECGTVLSNFGYKSALLSDHYVNVYSTNFLSDKITCVYEPYISKKCKCAIKDVACLCCGLIVGYHVEQPCKKCLEGENNGHMWMFSEERIKIMRDNNHDRMESICFIRLGRKSTIPGILEPER